MLFKVLFYKEGVVCIAAGLAEVHREVKRNMYEVAICDDMMMDLEVVEDSIKRMSEGVLDIVELRIHRYTSGEDLLNDMRNIRFSIVFMDVCLGNDRMGGEETAAKIRETDESVILVFLTGCAEPTPYCIEVQPYRYIKKNMPQAEFARNIADAMKKMVSNANMPAVMGKVNGESICIRPDDIIYVEKGVKHVKIYLKKSSMDYYRITDKREDTVIKCTEKLGDLYRQLKPYGFGYPHDSYMINFKYLISFKDDLFRLEEYPGEEFKIARSKAVEFNNLRRSYFRSKYE